VSYIIEYAALCETGKQRLKNQDNFWCSGEFLGSENKGLAEPLTGAADIASIPIFAVFDGMGGEKCGEVAAHLAARALDRACPSRQEKDLKHFFSSACQKMNAEVCGYAKGNHIGRMGTTAVMLGFGRRNVYLCNIGDSRAYLLTLGEITQISKDHVVDVTALRKPPLTQHLGIAEDEFVIEPYFAIGEYGDGDRYLLCSDGLTDMLSEKEMGAILSPKKPVFESAGALMEAAIQNGGADNITIILCELSKKKFFKRKVSK